MSDGRGDDADEWAWLRAEFPELRVVHKRDDRLSLAIDRALRVLTLGGQSAFLTRYVTTIGRTIYLPEGWEARDPRARRVTARHEAVHLRQFRRHGLAWMTLVYLVPVLPMGLAWGRARIEWEAYAETLRATAEELGLDAARSPALADHIVLQFTGPAYGWMWPFAGTVRRWIQEELRRIEAGLG